MKFTRQIFSSIISLLVLGHLLVFTGGCGYSNPHTRTADFDKDGDGKIRIFLNMWDNKTNLLGFQGQIQQSLIQVLTKSNRFYLTQNKPSADFILEGTIYSVEIPGLSYGLYDRAIQVRAEVKLGYKLVDSKKGKTVLKKDKFIKRESFRVADDAVGTQSNQDLALADLAESIADNIDIQLFYLFTREDIGDSRELVPSDDIEQLD